MKKWNLKWMNAVLWITAMTLFTSCLEGGRNTTSGTIIGVVRFDTKTFKNVLDVYGGTFYAPQFDTMQEGTCCIIVYELDFNAPENDATLLQTYGYYTVTISYKEDIDKYALSTVLTDTTAVMPEETAVMDPINSTLGYLNGILFLAHQLKKASDQRETWYLSYDPQATVKEENGRQIYDVYLRTTVRVSSTKTPEDGYDLCAYDMKYFMENAAQRVKSTGNTSFYIRFNYVSEIKDDTLTWGYKDLEMTVADIIPETTSY
ncbi:MAG: hypothetical protein LBB90_10955 [Tannerella sp.]|jgi:hypothetical protein|nr:hypothetical protein [Tannerella sp.]